MHQTQPRIDKTIKQLLTDCGMKFSHRLVHMNVNWHMAHSAPVLRHSVKAATGVQLIKTNAIYPQRFFFQNTLNHKHNYYRSQNYHKERELH